MHTVTLGSRNARSLVRSTVLALVVLTGPMLAACGNCEDEIKAAEAFIDDPANRNCKADSDCEGARCILGRR